MIVGEGFASVILGNTVQWGICRDLKELFIYFPEINHNLSFSGEGVSITIDVQMIIYFVKGVGLHDALLNFPNHVRCLEASANLQSDKKDCSPRLHCVFQISEWVLALSAFSVPGYVYDLLFCHRSLPLFLHLSLLVSTFVFHPPFYLCPFCPWFPWLTTFLNPSPFHRLLSFFFLFPAPTFLGLFACPSSLWDQTSSRNGSQSILISVLLVCDRWAARIMPLWASALPNLHSHCIVVLMWVAAVSGCNS